VFNSFGNNRKGVLFTASVIFLIGLVLFVISNFEIQHLPALIIPASLMIIGVGLLMTYIDGDHITFVFILSLLLIAAGIIITVTHGEFTFHSFISSLFGISTKSWPVLLIFAGVFVLFRKRNT